MQRSTINFVFIFHWLFCNLVAPLESDEKLVLEQKGLDWEFAKPGEYPWVVSLQENIEALGFSHICGGSLATARIVLTACHCLVEKPLFSSAKYPFIFKNHHDKIVVAGSVNNKFEDANSEKIVSRISNFKVHSLCHHFSHDDEDGQDFGGWDNDYGLIKLKSSVPIDGKKIATFTLLSTDVFELRKELMKHMITKGDCIVVGWGRRVDLSKMQQRDYVKNSKSAASHVELFWPRLTTIKVSLMDFATCYNIMCTFDECYCSVDHWSRKHICAVSSGRMEACEGDSGGPLMCGPEKHLVAIVGWGPSCGRYKVPTMYPTIHGGWDFIAPILNISDSSLPSSRSSKNGCEVEKPSILQAIIVVVNLFITEGTINIGTMYNALSSRDC